MKGSRDINADQLRADCCRWGRSNVRRGNGRAGVRGSSKCKGKSDTAYGDIGGGKDLDAVHTGGLMFSFWWLFDPPFFHLPAAICHNCEGPACPSAGAGAPSDDELGQSLPVRPGKKRRGTSCHESSGHGSARRDHGKRKHYCSRLRVTEPGSWGLGLFAVASGPTAILYADWAVMYRRTSSTSIYCRYGDNLSLKPGS